MIVLKSTYDAAVQRAKASGRALSEVTGELIKGMRALGFDPNPKHATDTTAAIVLRALKGAVADAAAARIETQTAQRERDDALVELRALKDARKRSNAPLAEWNARGRQNAKPTNGAHATEQARA